MRHNKAFSLNRVRKNGLIWLVFGLIFSATTRPSLAQDNKGIGLHGAPFLRISSTARAVALGEAYSALGGGEITGLRYNPATQALIRKIQLAANFHNWIGDTEQGAIAVALPTKLGVFAADFSYFNEGEITELDESFFQTGGSSFSDDLLFTLAYANALKIKSSRISFGAAVKLLRQNLIGEQSTAYGADVGMQYSYKFFALSAAAQNIGINKISFAEQSVTLAVDLARRRCPLFSALGCAASEPRCRCSQTRR